MANGMRVYTLQGNWGYGDGWEDLAESVDRLEVQQDLDAYLENDPTGQFRIRGRNSTRDEAYEFGRSDRVAGHGCRSANGLYLDGWYSVKERKNG